MKAWRILNGRPAYVESINMIGAGDAYSYTYNEANALTLTARQCLSFCRYMQDCCTRGYHS